ncbi:hypothetical protein JCM16303_007071 [Sporobolomyces ruberrimus]
MPVYALGSNEHGQVDPHALLLFAEPQRLGNCSGILAASWSQVIVRETNGDLRIRGLPLETPLPDFSRVKTWLGQEEFLAVLLYDGRIRRLEDGATTETKYSLASMNSRGELLVVPAFFDPSRPAGPTSTKFELPFYPSTSPSPEHISSISSGASNFIVLAFPSSRLFSLGDNRYGQLGVPQTNVHSSEGTKLHRVEAFDGLRIAEVSTGAFHSAVLTESGECYFFGSDQQGQCGGTEGGWEPTINDTLETEYDGDEANGVEESMSDIMQVCAFGESTVLRTRAGQIWVAGANHSGQLGFEPTKESLTTFTKHLAFGADYGTTKSIRKVAGILCSRLTVYLDVEESATG